MGYQDQGTVRRIGRGSMFGMLSAEGKEGSDTDDVSPAEGKEDVIVEGKVSSISCVFGRVSNVRLRDGV